MLNQITVESTQTPTVNQPSDPHDQDLLVVANALASVGHHFAHCAILYKDDREALVDYLSGSLLVDLLNYHFNDGGGFTTLLPALTRLGVEQLVASVEAGDTDSIYQR